MKKVLSLAALIMLLGDVTAYDQSAKSRQPSPRIPNLENYAGRDLNDLLRDEPSVKRRLNALLGKNHRLFMNNLTVAATLENRHGFLMMHGIAPHRGGEEEAIFLMSISSQRIHCAVLSRRFGGKYKVFSEDTSGVPSSLIKESFRR